MNFYQKLDLIDAARKGNIVEVNTLVNKFELYHPEASSYEYTALHQAIEAAVVEGHLKIIENLLKCGADVNSLISSDNGYTTLLHEAVNWSQIEVIKLLIKHDADVHAINQNGHLPIFSAVEKDNVDMTRLLLSSGTEIKYCGDLLHIAVKRRSMEMFYMILNVSGLDVNTSDEKFGRTALHWTAIREQLYGLDYEAAVASYVDIECQMAAAILSRGANVNAQCTSGNTALHYAVEHQYIGVIEILLKHKADVNFRNKMEETPLHYSAKQGSKSMVTMLLNNGARINYNYECIETALHKAIEWGHTGVVEILLKHGADVNSMNEYKQTPLHFSAKKCDETIMRMLVNNGARINDKDVYGKTALHVSCDCWSKKCVAALLEYGADIDTMDDRLESSPLRSAIVTGQLAIVKNLLKYFADTECRDIGGETALHIAVKFSKTDIIGELLEHGSDINVTSNAGCTPFDYLGNDYVYSRDDSFRRLTEVIYRHIVKMKALSMYVSPSNLKLTDVENDHKDFYEMCKSEVETSKAEKISDTNVTYHDLMTKVIDQLAIYARNPSIVETLESGKYKLMFKIYANIIHNNFRKAEKRESLLNSSEKTLNFLSRFVLPELLTATVLKNLSNKELENLIRAGP